MSVHADKLYKEQRTVEKERRGLRGKRILATPASHHCAVCCYSQAHWPFTVIYGNTLRRRRQARFSTCSCTCSYLHSNLTNQPCLVHGRLLAVAQWQLLQSGPLYCDAISDRHTSLQWRSTSLSEASVGIKARQGAAGKSPGGVPRLTSPLFTSHVIRYSHLCWLATAS